MPTRALSALAKQAGVSVDRAETLWKKAKALASKEGKSGDWQYIMGILKKMLKLENSSSTIRAELGTRPMKVDQRVIEARVYNSIFKDADSATATAGQSSFGVKIRYTVANGTNVGTQVLSIRSNSPEGAKRQALISAREMGYTNVSVIEVVPFDQQKGGETKWQSGDAVIQHDPELLVGLVLPTAIHPGLDTSQVLLPGRK